MYPINQTKSGDKIAMLKQYDALSDSDLPSRDFLIELLQFIALDLKNINPTAIDKPITSNILILGRDRTGTTNHAHK